MDDIRYKKEEIVKRYGGWTAHNIMLGGGVYTINEKLNYDTLKLRRVMQIINDLSGGDLRALKVLDLGSFEGLYTIELALEGASHAAGIEAREANLKKAEFSGQTLGVKNVTFHKDDVRNISVKKYGKFDVVLCLGLLYHLDAPDLFHLLDRIYEVCERFLVIDTHITPRSDEKVTYRSSTYFGTHVREFKKGLSKEKKESLLWNALDNEKSLLLSKQSLIRIISDIGFTSVYECLVPFEYTKPKDRVTLVAIKGKRIKLSTYPGIDGMDEHDIKDAIMKCRPPAFKRGNPAVLCLKKIRRALAVFFRTVTGRYYKET